MNTEEFEQHEIAIDLIYEAIKALKAYRTFRESYPDLPYGSAYVLYPNASTLNPIVRLSFPCYDGNRERLLAAFGQTFGRDGWVIKDGNSSSELDWQREIDGVRVILSGAQKLDIAYDAPVPATSFPMLLLDAEVQYSE